ncbi:MAG: Hsp20 family protein [Lentisphaerae bacterium]|nr:Hsp20 family protein [Lentisphaerota bacterium]
MDKKTKNNKTAGAMDLDLGIGGLSLGGLFKSMENLIDLAAELNEAGGALNKEGEVDLGRLRKGMKAVYGFSVKTMAGGKSVVEPFGNIKKTPQGPKLEEEREPITDLFDEKDEIRVCVEMPGLNEADIQLDIKTDILEITAQTGDRKYRKEILLPVKAKPENMTSAYRNGILELRIKKP